MSMRRFSKLIESAFDQQALEDQLSELHDRGATIEQMLQAVKQSGVELTETDIPNHWTLDEGYLLLVFDQDGEPSIVDAHEYISWMDINQVWNLLGRPEGDYEVQSLLQNPVPLYHGTTKENADLIIQQGLQSRNETRGITNRGTPAAVFAHTDPGFVSFYGDAVIEINLPRMVAEGQAPEITREEPIVEGSLRESLAHALNLGGWYVYEDMDGGMHPETFILYGDIPPQYLRRYS